MQNKKAQQMLNGVIVAIFITSVFSFAFITEQNKNIKDESLGGMKITGMATLDDTLDDIAGDKREIVVRAKDDNYYLIRKKGDEWYYGYTTVRVTAKNMNTAFDYYKTSEAPQNIKIKTGAPFEKLPITGMVTDKNSLQLFSSLPSSSEQQDVPTPTDYVSAEPTGSTGMEGVSGFVTSACYSADGKTKLSTCPGTNTAHIMIETRDDGVRVKKIYGEKGTQGIQLIETYWAPQSDSSNFREGDPPQIESTTDTYVADIVELDGTKKTYDIGEWSSTKEAQTKCGDKCKNVRKKKESAANDKKFYVLNKGGTVIGFVESTNKEKAEEEGKFLAENIKKDEFGKVESPTVEFPSPVKGGEPISYTNTDLETAKKDYESKYGFAPTSHKEIMPGTITTGDTYYLVDKGGRRINTFNNINAERAEELEKSYKGKYPDKEFKLEKAPSIEDLEKLNPGVSREILLMEYKNVIESKKTESEESLKEPEEPTSFTRLDGKIVYYFNNVPYEDENKAKEAYAKAQVTFNKALADKFAKGELDKKENKEKQLKLTGDITENDELLAKDGKGGVYKFVPTKDGEDKITGGTFKSVSETYTTKETITKGDDSIDIISTFNTETKKQTEVKVKTKDGKSATVDEETVKQVKDAQAKGLKIGITQEGVIEPNTKTFTDQIIEFTDKDGNLVARTTLSASYSLQSGTKTTEKFKTAYFYEGKEISKEEFEKLKKEGKDVKEELKLPTFKRTEEKENGKIKYLTTYEFYNKFDKDKKLIKTYEGTKFDMDKKELVEFIYGEGEKKITLDKEGNIKDGDKTLLPNAQTALKQYKSRQYFAIGEFALTEFRGLGYFATWFFDDNELEEWKESVDKLFSEAYLGVEYWVSGICSSNVERDQKGVAYVDTRLGLAGVAAHIEATRSAPVTGPNGTEYIYKITFNVKNGDWDKDPKALEEMEFNVYLYGDRTAKLLSENKKLEKGQSYGRLISDAIAQYSEYYYTQICIKFKEVPSFWTLDDDKLCNTIQGPSTEAETISSGGTTSQGGAESGFLQI